MPPSLSLFCSLSQLWRQSGPVEMSSRWGRCCYWNKMAERAGGAEESWGNAEEKEEGGEEFTPVCAVLPKEQHPRRGARRGGSASEAMLASLFRTIRDIVLAVYLGGFEWRYCIRCNQEPSVRTSRVNHDAFSRGQPGTLTSLPEMSLLCVGGKGTLSECGCLTFHLHLSCVGVPVGRRLRRKVAKVGG